MKAKFLLDTGPLVAFLNRRDHYHAWSMAQLATIAPPLLTCEAVLSEACFLLRTLPGGSEAVITLVQRGLVTLPFRLEQEVSPIRKLLARYRTVPMSLADACLVRMAEQHTDSILLTMDSDFRIYRKHGRHVIPTLMPKDL